MRMTLKSVAMALAIAFMAAIALTGCREPGPAEEAGREVDETVEDARDALDEMGEDAEDALEDIEEEINDD